MKQFHSAFILSLAVLCCCAPAFGVGVMSKYGEIQNVQNYSSNPFWTPDSPYNQRIPTLVFATGADLSTGDCNRVVESLISSYCAANKGCANLRLTDVRPRIMIQLSQLPGHNFATSCGGYIDTIFEKYKGKATTVSVPASSKTATAKNTISLENPYAIKPTEYQAGVAARTTELADLQAVTTPTPEVRATDFPKTIDDLSFTDRWANTAAGYEPYKDLKPYSTPQFESEEEYYARMRSVLEHTINYETFGGTPTSAEPTKYLTGRGATVSWQPRRDHSVFTGWCRDAAFTDCAMTHTIPSTDRDDKTFYAHWECEAGFTESTDGKACIDPATQCTDDPHMEYDAAAQKCVCPDPFMSDPADDKKCVCINGEDPANNCAEPEIPQCLVNVANDTALATTVATKLSGARTIDIPTLKTNGAYQDIAAAVHKYCVDSNTASPQDFGEFNTWIDAHDDLPISLSVNGTKTKLNIDAEDLFNHVNFVYDVLIVRKDSPLAVQSTISRDDIQIISLDRKCGAFWTVGGKDAFVRKSAIAVAASGVYGDTLYNMVGDALLIGWSFPGKLIHVHDFGENNEIVRVTNYVLARKKIKQFAANLQSNGGCAGMLAVVYLITDTPDQATNFWGGLKEVIIKSEPFVIP